ncbi:MAG TPA: hypothetical protein VLA35_09090 [Thermoleophilia bacterium]|nr:hypothetical protein [Thermoleophilia bacterium]
MSQRAKQRGPAPPQRRRPDSGRSGFWRWLEYSTAWFGVAVLVLSFVVLAFPAAISVRDVISGAQTGSAAIFQLVTFLAAEMVVVFMIVLGAYAAAPHRIRLEPATVRLLGTLSFGGMFFLILLVLRGELYAAVPIIVYFLRIRRSLADELPVFAGGRLPPQRKEPRRDDVVRRPPRSWDEPGGRPKAKAGGTASKAGSGQAPGSGRRRGKKGRRPGAGGNRPKGR